MAKKAKKTPNQIAYDKEYKRIQQFVRRAEKRGYIFNFEVLPAVKPKRITKQMIADLKYLTADRLYAKSKTVDLETGEILPGLRLLYWERSQRALKASETRKQNKKAEAGFFTGKPAGGGVEKTTDPPKSVPQKTTPPADGGLTAYNNVVKKFLNRLQEETPPVIQYSSKRKYHRTRLILENIDDAKITLLGVVNEMVNKLGKSAVGWIFQDHADELFALLDAILFASSSTLVQSLISQIVSILKGGLSIEESKALTEQAEYHEDYEEPD